MFQRKASNLAKFIGLTLGVALSVFAVSFVTYATWSQPPSTPPTCPSGSPGCDAPVHVGSGTQAKSGPLGVGGVFQANSSAYLAVNSGSVGIGTASPGLRLDVQTPGYGLPASSGSTQTYGGFRVSPPSASGNVVLDMGTAGATGAWLQTTLRTTLGNTYPLLLNPRGGNVGIGTSTPGARLEVRESARFYDSAGNLILQLD